MQDMAVRNLETQTIQKEGTSVQKWTTTVVGVVLIDWFLRFV